MAQYGELRADFITYTTGVGGGEANHTITVSSLVNAPTFSGDVVITGDLDVKGTITVTGDVITTTGSFTTEDGNLTTTNGILTAVSGSFASGLVGKPAVTIGSNINGLYSPATNQLGISTSGTERFRFADTGAFGIAGANYGTSGQVLTSNGTGSAPTWSTAAGGASAINDLSDALTLDAGQTIGLGTGALVNDDGTGNATTALGYQALNSNTTGESNTAVGYKTAKSLVSANQVTAVGALALEDFTGQSSLGFGVAVGYRDICRAPAGDLQISTTIRHLAIKQAITLQQALII